MKTLAVVVLALAAACGSDTKSSSHGLSGTLAYAFQLNAPEQNGGVQLFDLADDAPKAKQLTAPSGATDHDIPLGWTSDGATLAYFRTGETAGRQVHTVQNDGSGDAMIDDGDYVSFPGGFDTQGRVWFVALYGTDDINESVVIVDASSRTKPFSSADCTAKTRGLAVSAKADVAVVLRVAADCSTDHLDIISTADASLVTTLPDIGVDLDSSYPWLEFNADGSRLYFYSQNIGLHSVSIDGSDDIELISADRFQSAVVPTASSSLLVDLPPHSAVVIDDKVFVYATNFGGLVAFPFDAAQAPTVIVNNKTTGSDFGTTALSWTSSRE